MSLFLKNQKYSTPRSILLATSVMVASGLLPADAADEKMTYVSYTEYVGAENYANLPDSGFVVTIENETTGNDIAKSEFIWYDSEGNPLYEELFHFALLDITAEYRNRDYIIDASGEFEDIYLDGRVAFYLKGKIMGKYLVTASADTGYGPLKEIFSNLGDKSSRGVLDRLDPDEFYPVYGDDSTVVRDAPTDGKFYLRIESENSEVLFGNFTALIEGTDYLHNHRALFGSSIKLKSDEETSFGASRTTLVAYAARPDTIPQRDVFLGTGGSAYFLRRQDVLVASETVSIVVRDSASGHVVGEQHLEAGTDYQIDYVQGVIILSQPLHATGGTHHVVREGTLGDSIISLIVQYEFSPTLNDADKYTYGGRIEHWINERVAVGVTGLRDSSSVADTRAIGANVHVLLGENSSADIEVAQARGVGYGGFSSADGGLTFVDTATAGTTSPALAYIVHVHADLADVFGPSVVGSIDAHYENMQAGFSTLDHEISKDQQSWGIDGTYVVSDQLSIYGTLDGFIEAPGNTVHSGEISAEYKVSDSLVANIGVKAQNENTIGVPAETGGRTDIGIRLAYDINENNTVYGFGQVTISNFGSYSRNDIFGVGGEFGITDNIKLVGEISSGADGVGRQLMLSYEPNEGSRYYLGYRFDPDQDEFNLSGAHEGSIVAGTRQIYNDQLSGFAEHNYKLFGEQRSVTKAYGLTYSPNPSWTFTGGMETGEIRDAENGNFDRIAPSFSVAYHNQEDLSAALRFEGRWDDGDGVDRDRTTYLLSSNIQYKFSETSRIMADLDAVISDSDQSSFLDGQFIEASVGYAYRPIQNDRLNLLFKYTYLYDMPGPDQVSVGGSLNGPKQKSSIFTVDAIYDINEKLSIGAKYGFRLAGVADRDSDVFKSNNAHLGVLRGDFYIAKEWDGMIEGRLLWTEETDIVETGSSAAIYRHFGDSLKAGVGYHFGNVNSDLRNIDNTDNGLFINIIAKY